MVIYIYRGVPIQHWFGLSAGVLFEFSSFPLKIPKSTTQGFPLLRKKMPVSHPHQRASGDPYNKNATWLHRKSVGIMGQCKSSGELWVTWKEHLAVERPKFGWTKFSVGQTNCGSPKMRFTFWTSFFWQLHFFHHWFCNFFGLPFGRHSFVFSKSSFGKCSCVGLRLRRKTNQTKKEKKKNVDISDKLAIGNLLILVISNYF